MTTNGAARLACCFRGFVEEREISFFLTPGTHQVGSDPERSLNLPHDGVSRLHATLKLEEGRVVIVDQGSKNGTFVNGHRVRRAEVGEGDRVAFGPVELQLETVPAADATLAVALLPERPDTAPPRPDRSTAPFRRSAGRAPSPGDRLAFPPGHIRGRSTAVEELYRQLVPLAESDLPVLIRGETGVGKELVAQTLHLSSERRTGPFMGINCAAIPGELLEAELFGIGERVATGVAGRRGQFQQAEGGTLFLDEVGEMPPPLQAKLLRVLQDRRLRPLGGTPTPIDVRLLTATNADLDALIDEGAFRRDLYFRIAGAVVTVPGLAERRDDIPLLVEGFLKRLVGELEKPIRGLTAAALDRLIERPWPGHIRQLEHELRRLVHVCPPGGTIDSRMIAAESPPLRPVTDPTPDPGSVDEPPTDPALPTLELAELERLAIREALRRTGGNQVQAARLLGISRHVLRRRLERLGGDQGTDG